MSDFTGIIGPRGSSKTTLMTLIAGLVFSDYFNKKKKRRYAIALMEYHRVNFWPVWAMVRATYPEANMPADPELYYMPPDPRRIKVRKLFGKIVFWDDLQTIFDLRNRELVPPALRIFLAMTRHFRSQIFYTTPSWTRADKDLRLGTGRLLRTARTGRLVFIHESRVSPDENDATGATLNVRPIHVFPHWIWLPFKPEDEMYPLDWKRMRQISKYVGIMFDSWAEVDLDELAAREAPSVTEKIINGVKQRI